MDSHGGLTTEAWGLHIAQLKGDFVYDTKSSSSAWYLLVSPSQAVHTVPFQPCDISKVCTELIRRRLEPG
jgi:hypothetical protein